MRNKCLLDTNVLIYALDKDSAFHEPVNRIIYQPENELFTTSKNIAEFISVVTKGEHPAFEMSQALGHIRTFESFITVLFPSAFSYLTFKDILLEYQPKGLKIHDFEIAAIALAHGVSTIVTANTKDFSKIRQIEMVKVVPDMVG
jgi:predicted nucleic acid-binding protein